MQKVHTKESFGDCAEEFIEGGELDDDGEYRNGHGGNETQHEDGGEQLSNTSVWNNVAITYGAVRLHCPVDTL